MQKYFNALFLIVILGLSLYIVRLQLNDKIQKQAGQIAAQQQTIAALQGTVQQVVDFLNKQQQAASSAGAAQQQGTAPSPPSNH